MADSNSLDTGMLLFGLAILLGVGLLFWKVSSAGKTTTTSFTRDEQGRIIDIIERTN